MPAKGKSKVSPKQRARIAAGRIAGKPAARIAAEVGLSESAVKKNVNDSRTVTLILGWKERERVRIDKGLSLALDGLLRDLKSTKPDIHGPARRDLLRFTCAGDPPLYRIADTGNSDGDFTLEEMLASMRRLTRPE